MFFFLCKIEGSKKNITELRILTLSACVCICVCVCVGACDYVCLRVCVFAYVFEWGYDSS